MHSKLSKEKDKFIKLRDLILKSATPEEIKNNLDSLPFEIKNMISQKDTSRKNYKNLFEHSLRVYKTCKEYIPSKLKRRKFHKLTFENIILLAAFLHDCGKKTNDFGSASQYQKNVNTADKILRIMDLSKKDKDFILLIIENDEWFGDLFKLSNIPSKDYLQRHIKKLESRCNPQYLLYLVNCLFPVSIADSLDFVPNLNENKCFETFKIVKQSLNPLIESQLVNSLENIKKYLRNNIDKEGGVSRFIPKIMDKFKENHIYEDHFLRFKKFLNINIFPFIRIIKISPKSVRETIFNILSEYKKFFKYTEEDYLRQVFKERISDLKNVHSEFNENYIVFHWTNTKGKDGILKNGTVNTVKSNTTDHLGKAHIPNEEGPVGVSVSNSSLRYAFERSSQDSDGSKHLFILPCLKSCKKQDNEKDFRLYCPLCDCYDEDKFLAKDVIPNSFFHILTCKNESSSKITDIKKKKEFNKCIKNFKKISFNKELISNDYKQIEENIQINDDMFKNLIKNRIDELNKNYDNPKDFILKQLNS